MSKEAQLDAQDRLRYAKETLKYLDLLTTLTKNKTTFKLFDSFVRKITNNKRGSSEEDTLLVLSLVPPNTFTVTWHAEKQDAFDSSSSSSSAVPDEHLRVVNGIIYRLIIKKEKSLPKTFELKLFENQATGSTISIPPLLPIQQQQEDNSSQKKSKLTIASKQEEEEEEEDSTIVVDNNNNNNNKNIDKIVETVLKTQAFYADQIIFEQVLEKETPEYEEVTNDGEMLLHAKVREGLVTHFQITKLYKHQQDALRIVLQENRSCIIATKTASGKSLIFACAMVEKFLSDRSSKGLLLFPTKALSQDIFASFASFFEGFGMRLKILDGDTVVSEKTISDVDVLITNPDFLHYSLLPKREFHEAFLSKLRLVVLDECHTYVGPFGAHVCNVVRRMRRSNCEAVFIGCSATIQNPREHFETLIGAPVGVVLRDTSPKGRRRFLLWEPSQGKSPIFETAKIFSCLVGSGVKTILFCHSRKLVELLFKYALEILKRNRCDQALLESVMSYRGGYVKEERRAIERKMFANELLGLVTTNALELGIDLGYLDCVLVLGMPASISSLHQQIGRVGRSGRDALQVLVLFSNTTDANAKRYSALDAYYRKNPSLLFHSSSVEAATVDATNELVLKFHLLCAASENEPLCIARDSLDSRLFGGASCLAPLVQRMVRDGLLLPYHDRSTVDFRVHHARVCKPHRAQSLRRIEERVVLVRRSGTREVINEIAFSRSFFELYAGAVYMHQGRSFIVLSLNEQEAVAEEVAKLNYYTSAVEAKHFAPTKRVDSRKGVVDFGLVSVKTNIAGYRKHYLFRSDRKSVEGGGGGEVFPVHNHASYALDTIGVWFSLNRRAAPPPYVWHAMQHLVTNQFSRQVLLDSSRASIVSSHRDDQIFFYDADPGGNGSCNYLFTRLTEILASCASFLETCACANGCPQCIFDMTCVEFNNVRGDGLKAATLGFVRELLKQHFLEEDQDMAVSTQMMVLPQAKAEGFRIESPTWMLHQ